MPTDTGTEIPKRWSVGTLTYTIGGVVALFCWLLWGDFAWAMKDRGLGNVAAVLAKSFDISDFAYGILIVSFPNFTNIILQPIISYQSDRHRGRLGRRIPYLIFTTPFVAAGVIGLGMSPMLGRMLQNMVGAEHLSYNMAGLIMFAIFWACIDFGATLSGAIFGALINDVVPTCLLGRFFALFRAISLIAGILFNSCLLEHAEKYAMPICLGLGLLYAAGLTLLCTRVKEGDYPPPETVAKPRERWLGPLIAVKTYFVESFSQPYYRWVSGAFALMTLGILPFNMFTYFYSKSLNMSLGMLGQCLAITYAISLGLSYFLGSLSDRFHPLRMGIASIGVYGALMLAGGILVDGAKSYAVFLVLHGVVSGCFFTLTASYGQRLFPRERFAQFNSATCLLVSLGSMLMAPLLGKFLDGVNRDYRYTFFAAALISLLGLLAALKVYRGYLRYGGDEAYTAPAPRGERKGE